MAISDRRLLSPGSLIDWCVRLGEAGVDAIQLREKDLSDRELFELAKQIRKAVPEETRILINSRPDLVLAAGADGVHLPAAGLPIRPIRQRFGSRLLIGRSTHSADEVEAARQEGADYALFGPVYPTPTKARYGSPLGLDGLRRAVAHGTPILALGGVTIERLMEIADAGAIGAAGIRVFHDLERLGQLVDVANQSFVGT